jgi:hypothetical protein
MKRLLSIFAAVGALSLALATCPGIASAASPKHVVKIMNKQTGTVVEKAGSRTVSLHFNSQGKLISATETGGAHGMTPVTLTVGKHPGPKTGAHGIHTVYDVCYQYVCDSYGYCWYYYCYC